MFAPVSLKLLRISPQLVGCLFLVACLFKLADSFLVFKFTNSGLHQFAIVTDFLAGVALLLFPMSTWARGLGLLLSIGHLSFHFVATHKTCDCFGATTLLFPKYTVTVVSCMMVLFLVASFLNKKSAMESKNSICTAAGICGGIVGCLTVVVIFQVAHHQSKVLSSVLIVTDSEQERKNFVGVLHVSNSSKTDLNVVGVGGSRCDGKLEIADGIVLRAGKTTQIPCVVAGQQMGSFATGRVRFYLEKNGFVSLWDLDWIAEVVKQ
jgi:hypothetical protein